MKLMFVVILAVLLSACGPSQSEIDANIRAAQAEQRAAVQEQQVYDANRRADAAQFQATIIGLYRSDAAVLALVVIFALVSMYLVFVYLMNPSGQIDRIELLRERNKQTELENERVKLLLEAQRQSQSRPVEYDQRLAQLKAKYGPVPQLPPRS